MARKHEPLTFAGSLESQAQKPLDARRKVTLIADLTDAASFPYIYKGLDVFCEENDKWYTFLGGDTTDAANWREEGSGSSSGGGAGSTYAIDWDSSTQELTLQKDSEEELQRLKLEGLMVNDPSILKTKNSPSYLSQYEVLVCSEKGKALVHGVSYPAKDYIYNIERMASSLQLITDALLAKSNIKPTEVTYDASTLLADGRPKIQNVKKPTLRSGKIVGKLSPTSTSKRTYTLKAGTITNKGLHMTFYWGSGWNTQYVETISIEYDETNKTLQMTSGGYSSDLILETITYETIES